MHFGGHLIVSWIVSTFLLHFFVLVYRNQIPVKIKAKVKSFLVTVYIVT